MILKVRKILSKWKGRHLSFAGRITLLESVIIAVPLLYLSMFKMPSKVKSELTKI